MALCGAHAPIGYYDPTINASTTGVEAKQKEAEHKEKLQLYQVYLGVEQALHDKIVAAVDRQHLAELDEKYVGYAGSTALDLIEHLRNGYCKIIKYRMYGYAVTAIADIPITGTSFVVAAFLLVWFRSVGIVSLLIRWVLKDHMFQP